MTNYAEGLRTQLPFGVIIVWLWASRALEHWVMMRRRPHQAISELDLDCDIL